MLNRIISLIFCILFGAITFYLMIAMQISGQSSILFNQLLLILLGTCSLLSGINFFYNKKSIQLAASAIFLICFIGLLILDNQQKKTRRERSQNSYQERDLELLNLANEILLCSDGSKIIFIRNYLGKKDTIFRIRTDMAGMPEWLCEKSEKNISCRGLDTLIQNTTNITCSNQKFPNLAVFKKNIFNK